jgi:uncharacterized protein YjbI with pentapeptide repeats
MDPTVVAAWIAAGAGIFTLIGTVTAQIIGFRSTKADNKEAIKGNRENTADFIEQQRKQLAEQREQLTETLKAQSDQLDRTLAEQNQQLDRTLAEQRTRTLNERFATAAEQLGSDKPAVRLAGVYAMAGLADDWEENRQTCVDVLCAYLQLPYEPDPGENAPEPQQLAFQASQKVRHTVIRVIAAHLREDARTSWRTLNFDFTGVVFDGGDFSGAEFSSGTVNFDYAWFSGGTVNFGESLFSGGRVSFRRAEFCGGTVFFGYSEFTSGSVDFGKAEFSSGTVIFDFSLFAGAWVYFTDAKFSGGEVDFNETGFSGGAVAFNGARFSGGTVSFGDAEFSGGIVDFSQVADWSVPPSFPRTDTPLPGLKLPGAPRP